MNIVADLGCHAHYTGLPESLDELARKYRPDLLYGFDPHPDTNTAQTDAVGVPCGVRREAAWVTNGKLRLTLDGTSSRIDKAGVKVRCFDFPHWLLDHPCAVVKMDIEGAEYELLERIVNVRADRNIGLLLVEWHERRPRDRWRRKRIEDLLRCPVEEWWM